LENNFRFITGEQRVKKEDLQDGRALLNQPVLPLVSMVQFMYQLSSPETKIADIIAEMSEPIETAYTVYPAPDKALAPYLEQLQLLERMYSDELAVIIIDTAGQPVDTVTGYTALINQRIMEIELEKINSLLCAPCHCRLCCVGPEKDMKQEFFEIPLQEEETKLFALQTRHDTPDTRCHSALAEDSLLIDGLPFYQTTQQAGTPELFHWQNGWSMILPKDSACPALEQSGRCSVYNQRPQVCRHPQIFSYIIEPLEQDKKYMLRNSLLAVSDCPYVQFLKEEINTYAAACELELLVKANKG
jgi:Fe-S-cluster containining protein